ncbi:thioesterase II family protein [Pseudosporangium ferrugineum]|uniref:Pyochelin biosynthetic protein PchC n=1 Tax=Pseudosporangium ferrugineum TaxID=439699 RepID=A0A2T0R772_9ACTN|nr:alpha/beta fold hydrolase [Pseudosporangium ferrugineum]PRY17002.1 pyochelin biosynthetic protein PchC [Pseudosporangium ferrugineum]
MTPSHTDRDAFSRWFRTLKAPDRPRLRLVCFPHAGGAASYFRSWTVLLPDDVELLAVRYPGREDRFHEPATERMQDLADAIAQASLGLARVPTAFFGHSMGASVAYEVAIRLEALAVDVMPRMLFLSGRLGPGSHATKSLAEASDEELILELSAMSEVNVEVFAIDGLRDLLLPVIRADYRLIERYQPALPPSALNIPLVVYYGDQDEDVNADKVSTWAATTRSHFSTRAFPGGHFYLDQHAETVVRDMLSRTDRM